MFYEKEVSHRAPSNTSELGTGRREFFDITAGAALSAVFAAQAGSAFAAEGQAGTTTYRETLRTPIVGRYQVIVAGCGPSGVIAAAAAARSGAKTVRADARLLYATTGGKIQRLVASKALEDYADVVAHLRQVLL